MALLYKPVWEDALQGDFGVNPIDLRRDLATVSLALSKHSGH